MAKTVQLRFCQCGNVYGERRDLGAVNTPSTQCALLFLLLLLLCTLLLLL
jgi:hypothetical protein